MNDGFEWELLPCQPSGLRVQRTHHSLAELADLDGTRVAAAETFLGSRCVRVETRGFKSVWGQPLRCSFLVDEEHGFAPRRVAIFDDSDRPDAAWYCTWETTALQQIANVASGQSHWFPRAASMRQPAGRHEMVVINAEINTAIPQNRFRPEPPDGTLVTDVTAGGANYIVGGNRAVDAQVRKSVAEAKEKARSTETPPTVTVDARPRAVVFVRTSILVASLLALVVGAALLVRRRTHV